MQTGVLSSENLADVLRGISQRRRQGLLEINSHDEVITIKFVQGRVVEATTSRTSPFEETAEWFIRAHYPVNLANHTVTSYPELATVLLQQCREAFLITEDQIREVIRHRILDRLHKLEVGSGTFYSFKVQMIDYDREFAPSISIGQVLLDLVELSTERDEFHDRFADDSYLRPTGAPVSGLGHDAESVLRTIGKGCSLLEAQARSLVSAFHFRHTLLELASNSIISIGDGITSDTPSAMALDLDSFLDESVSSAFGADLNGDNIAVRDDTTESLQDLVESSEEEEGWDDEGSAIQVSYLQACSAQLLQNTLVPRLVALGFLILAAISPFLAWTKVIAAFADMVPGD